MSEKPRWNGAAIYVDDDGPTIITEKDTDDRWIFHHVCCDCWKIHAVQVEVTNGHLSMRWLEPYTEESAKIHRRMERDGRFRLVTEGAGDE